jgi:hypothetical protein
VPAGLTGFERRSADVDVPSYPESGKCTLVLGVRRGPLGRMNLRAVALADRRHWHASVVLVKDLRLRALS